MDNMQTSLMSFPPPLKGRIDQRRLYFTALAQGTHAGAHTQTQVKPLLFQLWERRSASLRTGIHAGTSQLHGHPNLFETLLGIIHLACSICNRGSVQQRKTRNLIAFAPSCIGIKVGSPDPWHRSKHWNLCLKTRGGVRRLGMAPFNQAIDLVFRSGIMRRRHGAGVYEQALLTRLEDKQI